MPDDLALLTSKRLQRDGQFMRVMNYPEANDLLERVYRELSADWYERNLASAFQGNKASRL